MQFRSICLWIMLLCTSEVSSLSLSKPTAQLEMQEAKETTSASQAKNVLRMKPYNNRPAFPDDGERHAADMTYADKKEMYQKKLSSTKESYTKRLQMKTESTTKNTDSMNAKWVDKQEKTNHRMGVIAGRLTSGHERIDKHKAEKGQKTNLVYNTRRDGLKEGHRSEADYKARKAEIDSSKTGHEADRAEMTEAWKAKYETNWKEQQEYVELKRADIDDQRKDTMDAYSTDQSERAGKLETKEVTGMNARLRQKRDDFWNRLEAHKENVNSKVANLQGRKGSLGDYGPQYDDYTDSEWQAALGEPSYTTDGAGNPDWGDSSADDFMSYEDELKMS